MDRAAVFREEGYNVSAAARRIGITRQSMQDWIAGAVRRGVLTEEEASKPLNVPRDDYMSARERMIATYQKKQRKGDWRKPVMVRLPGQPFRLKLFGDPHLDADGCNFGLFERHWLDMDAANGTYGVCIGDWFNNWVKSLSHLWKGEGDPSDAWLALEYLMSERGDALLGACSGNHDDWTHAPADPVDLLMKRYGVVYRKGAVRLALAPDGHSPIMVALRHKWRGHSMYSAAHGIVRGAVWGWRDHIMVGGHIHQDEPRLLSFPDGFRAHVCQISAFKEYDEFVDVQGFMGPRISPVWDLVIDPRKADTDPDKVKVFWSSDDAAGYLAWLRR